MSKCEVLEESIMTLDPEKVIEWVKNIREADNEEIHIESMRHRRWIIRRSDFEQGVLVVGNCDVMMKFDDVGTDGIRILFYCHDRLVCTMHPRVGWLARRVAR